MDDADPAQSAPEPGRDLTGFPTAELAAGRRVFRAHEAGFGPWWFNHSDRRAPGRFDLAPPRGTLYLADDIESAVREFVRGRGQSGLLLGSMVETMQVSSWSATRTWTCAHIDVRAAARFGVTRELASVHGKFYPICQAWAEGLADAGFQGVRYGARFTPGRANAWALFGEAGDGEAPPPGDVETISGHEACRRAGLTVLLVPPAGTVHVVP
jgi:hypothetical protein